MAIAISGTLESAGKFPLAFAKDVEMPDGTRLSEVALGGGGTDPRVDALLQEVNAMFDGDGKLKPEYLPEMSAEDPRVDELIETVGSVFDANGKINEVFLPEEWVKNYVEEYIDEALRGDY